MAAKLKVFTWSDGFHAYTIATTSRAKALKAWGVSRDLFKDSMAREIDCGADYERALAEPDVVIERGETIDPGKLTALKPKAKTKTTLVDVKAPRGPDPKDVRRVETLKDELKALEASHAANRSEREAAIEALETERRDAEQSFKEKRAALKAKLAEAERRLR